MSQLHEHLRFLWHNSDGDDILECKGCDETVVRKCQCESKEADGSI